MEYNGFPTVRGRGMVKWNPFASMPEQDVPALAKIESTKEIQDFMRTAGWAYMGEKNWEGISETKIASILNHVTENYPPTFIIDGNTASFEDQGKALVSALQNKEVTVDSLFFDKNVFGKLGHEFQFKMNSSAGQDTFNKVLEFLNKTK
ncbi:hypothetical protein [Bacillus cereus]|uniref:hypothetical protein n=1 Tax=Bacillus cereus TaxID=1396 RepID=UPI00359F5323